MLSRCGLQKIKDCKVVKLLAIGVVAVTSCLGIGVLIYRKLADR